jgi:hypothetical protein
MIDNFNVIRPLLKFENDNQFYFIQLFKRRKDNPTMDRDMVLIDNFFVYSPEDLDGYKERIVEICTRVNCRAYIRLNRRDAGKVALKTLSKLAELIYSNNPKQAKSCYLSACGETNCETDKTWIVDVDEGTEGKASLESDLFHLQKEAYREPLCLKIPTKNGYHLITRPFNKQKFSGIRPKVDVHTDNPTLLFIS